MAARVNPKGIRGAVALGFACAFTLLGGAPAALMQERGNPPGEWRYIGGDAAHTRYSALDQINAANFEQLKVAWVLARR
jgi:quinoprotein glucose dehydrogenase